MRLQIALLLSLIGGSATAGTEAPPLLPEEPRNGSWCESLTDLAHLYKGDEASWLQELNLYFLYHHQFAYIDGTDRNGKNFNDSYDENRRLWWGFQGKAFNYFKFKAVSNFSRDRRAGGGEWQTGHENFRSAYVAFDAGEAFDWTFADSVEFGYGRRSIRMTDQWHRSASLINTIERADFSNKMWPNDEDSSNPLAAWVKIKRGISTFDIALVSTDEDSWMPQWDEGLMYFASWQGDFSSHTNFDTNDLWLSAFYQDVDSSDEVLAGGIEWAVAGVNRLENGPWALHSSIGVGDNGSNTNSDRQGRFWGAYIMPMYWLVDEKVKLVFRYQYQASDESEGIRLNSRYTRVAEDRLDIDINDGRGDRHHSAYAGLNWYLCGENAKVITGVIYEELESDGERIYDGWTSAVGLRVFF